MRETNWELLKFKYEVLGSSIEDLAAEHCVSKPVLEFNSRNWKKVSFGMEKPLDLEGVSSMEDILLKLGSETSSQTKAFAILKQKFLGPKYVELETVLLHKAIEMATELNSGDARAANTLRSLAVVLGDLLARNPLLTPGDEESEGEAREWKITVVDATEKMENKND
ncbi:MAG: hypothetical protein GOV02_02260 [Candidatus Aenigmarchaeota archaeon]|nr:hypothetical protein [Candidatus Aenigmarchaeota archaeon]